MKNPLSHLCRATTILLLTAQTLTVAAQTTSNATQADMATTAPPNIILIMADDLGVEALACYGNDINKTPNLDRLAAGGMKFTQAHSTPLCSPSRVQVMTGKYNSRNYIVFGVMDKNEKTFADYLKEAGYTTAVTGKWQLYGLEGQQERAGGRRGSRPEEVGFDEYCVWQIETTGSRFKDPTISTTTGTHTIIGGYGPDVFADFATDFIRQNRKRPFFLYYPMVHTHAPFQPVPGDPDYESTPIKGSSDPENFPGAVANMDAQIGRVINELEKLGLTTNTLVIFTADNGTDKRITSIVNGQAIQGGKGNTTRDGTNVPLIAAWPGTIKPGQTNDNLIDFTDMLPTFLEAAGKPVHADTDASTGTVGLDGISFYKQLVGQSVTPREWVFCYYKPELRNHYEATWAHTKTWKLYADGRFYNIAEDPREENPIPASDIPAEAAATRQLLQEVIDEKMTPPQPIPPG